MLSFRVRQGDLLLVETFKERSNFPVNPSKSLFEPFTFPCGTTCANRMVVSAMTNKMSLADGSMSDDDRRYLSLRMAGGWGAVTTCATFVEPGGRCWDGQLGLFSNENAQAAKKLLRTSIHITTPRPLCFVQLHHGGIRATESCPTASRDALGRRAPDTHDWVGAPARAFTGSQVEALASHFIEAAVRSERAGFDGCELHAAHGYLLCQFLSQTLNTRRDRYGGSLLKDRARLLTDIISEIRKKTSPRYVVGVRLTPENYADVQGITLEETMELTKILDGLGVDFIHYSLWDMHRKSDDASGLLIDTIASTKTRLLKAASGRVWNRQDAEWVLGRGIDFVEIGRASLKHPNWPKLIEGPLSPEHPPYSRDTLRHAGLGPAFVEYMRSWDGFVAP